METFKDAGVEPAIEETRKPMGMLKIDHIRAMLKMGRIEQDWERVHGTAPTEDDVQKLYVPYEEKLLSILYRFATPKPNALDAVIRNFEEPPHSCARSGRGLTGWLDPQDPLEAPRHQPPRSLATVAGSDKPSDKTPVGERPPVQKCSTRQLLVRDCSSFGQAALQNPSWRRAPCPKTLHSRWQVLAGRLRCPKTLRSRRMRARA